jgi:uncharacterized protein YndB with AHSA1/START domain
MWKKIAVGLLAVVAVFVVVVALLPSDFRIERSAAIAAPPEAVFAHVNDFRKWQEWSPWAKLDPDAKATFDGPDSGVGAKFLWVGNDDVGEGHMTITASQPSETIELDLVFIKPYESSAKTVFSFAPKGEETVVHWTMMGKNGFVERAICLFINMDDMVGGDFEKGLANLKSIVEAERIPVAAAIDE